MLTDKRVARIEDILRRKQPSLEVLVENIYSSQNLSAITRTSDAVGVLNLFYTTEEDMDMRVHRTITQGAHRWVNSHRIKSEDRVKFLQQKQADGFQVVVTHLNQRAVSFRKVDYTLPTILIMGNEKEGVSPEVVALADHVIIIPMQGMVQSLNVSVAAALILYEAERQLEEAGCYTTPQLIESTREQLRDEWIYRDMISRRSKGQIQHD